MDKNTKSEFSFGRFLILLTAVIGGLYLLFTYLRVVAGCIIIFGVGIFFFYIGFKALRKGSVSINARTKFVTYTRTNNPIEFWFYILFSIFMGILTDSFALILFLQHFNIIPNILK